MRITTSGNLPISVLLGLGAIKTGYDYYNSEPQNKKNGLIRNSVIIGSSIAGVVAAQKYSDILIKQKPIKKAVEKTTNLFLNIPKPKFINNILKKLFDSNRDNITTKFEETTECSKIIQNCLKDCFTVFSAICSGIAGAEVLNLTYFKKKPLPNMKNTKESELEPNYNIIANPDDGLEQISKILETDFKIFKTMDRPMAVFDAIKISEEKNPDTKIKMTVYEIIANALLPTFFISLAMSLTKNLKTINRLGIVGASAILGILLGHRLAVQFNRSITPQITETFKEIHKDITENIDWGKDN